MDSLIPSKKQRQPIFICVTCAVQSRQAHGVRELPGGDPLQAVPEMRAGRRLRAVPGAGRGCLLRPDPVRARRLRHPRPPPALLAHLTVTASHAMPVHKVPHARVALLKLPAMGLPPRRHLVVVEGDDSGFLLTVAGGPAGITAVSAVYIRAGGPPWYVVNLWANGLPPAPAPGMITNGKAHAVLVEIVAVCCAGARGRLHGGAAHVDGAGELLGRSWSVQRAAAQHSRREDELTIYAIISVCMQRCVTS